ncbi:NADH oxidase [Jeotgalibacillus soli]|uniref:NADH oxidase n=1 Tax=Jeotgalibacillus soli TaxID=889306 RepID=A0A0C2VLJ4_9BACL|nr:NADH oxidase [Jeotgalibacillus soli]
MRTSGKNVFAAGDSCAIYFNPAKQHAYIPLATNAVRMGTLAAINLIDPKVRYMGTQGTSGLYMYGYNLASTRITENGASIFDLKVNSSKISDKYRPEFMPANEEATLKVICEE